MFLFLFKSKYRRKQCNLLILSTVVILGALRLAKGKCQEGNCGGNGICRNETCVCYDGWQGPQCQFCGGKVR